MTLNSVLFFWELLFLCLFLLLFSHSVVSNCCDPRITVHQASLSFTISWSLLKLMSIESMTTFNHLTLSSPSPPTYCFPQHQGLFQWVSSSSLMSRLLGLQLQHRSFQWMLVFSSQLTFLVSKCKILYICDGFTLWSLLTFL